MNAFAFFLVIIGAIVVAIGGSHTFIYYTLTHVFALGDAGEYLLIVGLVVLPAAFIVSTIAAHYWDTFLTRTVYFISGVWLGLVTHLTLFWLAVWCIFGIGKWGNISIPLPPLIVFTGIAATLYTLYGAWNALTPRVTQIRVKIPGLPEAWRGKTAVQLSDLHLGLFLRDWFLRQVVARVRPFQPDIVFITGDIFDGTDGDLQAHLDPLRSLEPRWGTFFITGNHEVYLGVGRVLDVLKDGPLTVLDDKIVEVEGVQIVGVSYSKRSLKRDLSEILDRIGFRSDKPSILLYHEPEQVEEMRKKGISLQLSGHTHKGQMLPFVLLTRLIYGPYHHGLHQIGNYTLYTSSGVGLWGPTVRTGSKSEIVVIRFE